MAISFERIPSNIRVPLFWAEISAAEGAYMQLLQPTLLIGPMTTGLAQPLTPVLVSDPSQAAALFGAGSILADMVATYRRNDTFGTIYAIGVPDASGDTQASLTDTVAGTATAAGTMALYLGGERYAVTVALNDNAAAVAGKIVAAVNADPFALVAAAATGAEVTYTARSGGALGNQLSRIWNWRGLAGGEQFPAGISVTGDVAFTGGGGEVDLEPVIAAMADDDYDFIGMPWADATALDAMQEAMNDVSGRWAWSRQIYGHVWTAKQGTLQPLVDLGKTRNDPHMTIAGYAPSPSAPWRHAAAWTAQAAVSLKNDPARPLQTLPLIGVLPPLRGQRFSISDANTLLFNGIATEMENAGVVQIQREATTYRVNAWNQPDPSWLDVQTPFTLAYIIRFLRNRVLQKFPRHKLANDGSPLGFGVAVVTPRIIRAEIVAAYSELMSVGMVENMDAFKAFLVVERDQNDPNRVNVLLPPDLVNQLRIFAMLVQFRLQYAGTAQTAAAATAAAAAAALQAATTSPLAFIS